MTIQNLSITQKITALGSVIAICVAALIGLTSLYSSKDIIEQRMIESELPSKLQTISNHIGGEINELLGAALSNYHQTNLFYNGLSLVIKTTLYY